LFSTRQALGGIKTDTFVLPWSATDDEATQEYNILTSIDIVCVRDPVTKTYSGIFNGAKWGDVIVIAVPGIFVLDYNLVIKNISFKTGARLFYSNGTTELSSLSYEINYPMSQIRSSTNSIDVVFNVSNSSIPIGPSSLYGDIDVTFGYNN
jgi:hypothetical protein